MGATLKVRACRRSLMVRQVARKIKRREASRRWAARNKEKRKQYYLQNKAKILKWKKAWYKRNKVAQQLNNAQWYAENRKQVNDYRRYVVYGIHPETFYRLGAKQNGLCAICKKAPLKCVDHDHKTGKWRGLVCKPCNSGLGMFRDCTKILFRAIQYLQRAKLREAWKRGN